MKIFMIVYLAIMLVEVHSLFAGTNHVTRLRSVMSFREELESVGKALKEIAESQAAFTKTQSESQVAFTKTQSESLAAFTKTHAESQAAFAKTQAEVQIIQLKNEKQLGQLIGYNQNQDSSLEYSLALPLKNFILQTCRVPQNCLIEVDQKKIFDPASGDISAEWDAIFLVSYSNSNFRRRKIPHNTLFLLEAKQKVNATAVLRDLPGRLQKTITAINMPDDQVSKILKVRSKVAYQRGILLPNPHVVVAIGGRNIHDDVLTDIVLSGYIPIGPTGNEFKAYARKIADFKILRADGILKS